MKRKYFSKGQGEIFGIALLFVVIIIGIIIYGQIKALTPDREGDIASREKYELLAQSSLETILKTSTRCNVDGNSGNDSIQDLINVCLTSYGNNDISINCDGEQIYVCEKSIDMLESVLFSFYNGSDALLGNIPFLLEIDLPSASNSLLNSRNVTNFGNITFRDKEVNLSNYKNFGYKKASSDLKPWATAQRSIKMTLALYYR